MSRSTAPPRPSARAGWPTSSSRNFPAGEIPLHRLQLEVTETVFLGRGSDHVKDALGRLHRAGVRIALDDFGTGHAALLHLMQFPVDVLKIDRSFIAGLGRSGEAEAITKAIVGLGE